MYFAGLSESPLAEKGKILIVDDQPMNIKILHQLFHQDYEVAELTKLMASVPGVVIQDDPSNKIIKC